MLGKNGGLRHYCPYFPLTKQQWILPPNAQPEVNLWIMDALREMYHDGSKKGAQNLGVKTLPKITHIEVDSFVLPLTHMGLGIDNNIIAAYEDRVEAHIVKVPPDEQVKQVQLEEIDGEIEENREAVRRFDITLDGLSCNKLQQQQRDIGKTMTNGELALLTSLAVSAGE